MVLADYFFAPFFRRYFYYFDSYPIVIQIAILLTTIAVLATFSAYAVILYRRYAGNRHEKKLARINPDLDNYITENIILNEQLATGEPVNQIVLPMGIFEKSLYRRRWVQQATIDRIIHYRKNFGGEIGGLLKKLYIDLELDKVSFKRLKSVKWDKKVKALKELTAMDMSIADVNILPLTNSKNRELRSEARHAYIKLSKNEPFKFFDIVTEPLLMWDQLELFKIITTTKDISIPNFARWVTYSSNKSVVAFCLKLIVHYNQQQAIPAIEKLLDSKDHYLRENAINALGKLKAEDTENKLVSIYSNQPLTCQLEILKALGRMGTGNHLEFLRHEFLRSADFDVRKNAAKSIINHKADSASLLKELLDTATAENALILKHCMNPLIKY
ncbi:HEAT repeat domain-containing protein [Deminuibacter soli]|uniref:HEAT repeat domain-containing protein n=1 Tax=Deminuibacter soli TaxID=2291815 RepID=A0A3E1NLP4_9BACT|nr:HEAT repeat domain-containing protein [Deminuibacter soli]RFM28846.1 HEAT repeat domain-containing protein [Deminuibacter soli]